MIVHLSVASGFADFCGYGSSCLVTIDLANKILQNVSISYIYVLVKKLRINLGKCCYIKFRPISNITETHDLEDRFVCKIRLLAHALGRKA